MRRFISDFFWHWKIFRKRVGSYAHMSRIVFLGSSTLFTLADKLSRLKQNLEFRFCRRRKQTKLIIKQLFLVGSYTGDR
jgi:hypothetical protein